MFVPIKLETEVSEVIKLDKPVLVVDLDGTLLRSDMLHETFWNAITRDWRNLFTSLSNLARGRAAMKRYLSLSSDIDVVTLPYNLQVIDYVQNWRANGGRTALVTASDEIIGKAIAEHLDIFDEVHGSDGKLNLKGVTKADFLGKQFSNTGYIYIGDSVADIPVWAAASSAVIVNCGPGLRKRTTFLGEHVEHLSGTPVSFFSYLKALRPHQWSKNLLVFLPMIAGQQFDAKTLTSTIVSFISFSIIASSVYILNDLVDLKADRMHARKRHRPFAAGDLLLAHGAILLLVLIMAGSLLASTLGGAFAGVVALYLLTTLGYSLHLKRLIVLDIFVLAFLYTLRIIAGSIAGDIDLSTWLLAFSVFIFISLAAVKRQAELVDLVGQKQMRTAGRGYHVDDLPIVSQIAIAAGYAAVLVTALYVDSTAGSALYSKPDFLWGICMVLLFWVTRMVMLTHRGLMHDDPLVFAAKDRGSLVCLILMLGCILGATLL